MPSLCPKCSGEPVVVDTMTAHIDGTSASFDLRLQCSCGVYWSEQGLTHAQAMEDVKRALSTRSWVGTTRVAHALLLELAGKVAEAYGEYDAALRTRDTFGRAHCHERRASYEITQGWMRCALRSMRAAVRCDESEGGTRLEQYRAACDYLERDLAAKGIKFARLDQDDASWWLRACELEQPPGLGAVNELGEPLSDDIVEIERLLRAHRWRDAVNQYSSLEPQKKVDGIGYASRGVKQMVSAGERDAAYDMQVLVVEAYEIYASWSTSGGEGTARMADVANERKKLGEIR